MNAIYDSRTYDASGYATFFLTRSDNGCYPNRVDSADDILAELKRRGITHAQIAAALGVNTTNATKLYNPVGKTGKPRRMTYDEGVLLARTFNLRDEDASAPIPTLSLPVARLVVQYVASQLGMQAPVDDALAEETARDIQAFSEFAAQPQMRESVHHVEGFFQGRKSQDRIAARR